MKIYPGSKQIVLESPDIPEGFEGRIVLFLGGDKVKADNLTLSVNGMSKSDIIKNFCRYFGVIYSDNLDIIFSFDHTYKPSDEGSPSEHVQFEYCILYSKHAITESIID